MKEYTAAESAGYAAPPVGVAVLSFAGISLQDWVYITAITYSVIMIGEWVFRQIKRYMAWRRNKAS